jgi:hypothetical protein
MVRIYGIIIITGLFVVPSKVQIYVQVMTVKGVDSTGKAIDLKIISLVHHMLLTNKENKWERSWQEICNLLLLNDFEENQIL